MKAWNDQKIGSRAALEGSAIWRLMFPCSVLCGPDSTDPGFCPKPSEGSGWPANRLQSDSCTRLLRSAASHGGGVLLRRVVKSGEDSFSNAFGKCTPSFGGFDQSQYGIMTSAVTAGSALRSTFSKSNR